jgi:alpha-beta hydrolase superfamily lysophospholipase
MGQKAIHETALVLDRPDGARLAAYKWSMGVKPRGVLVIAHGMGEHARRYPPKLTALLESGIGDFGPGGLPALVEDLAALVALAREKNPRLPVVLLGHSMGSFIAQCFVLEHAALLTGLVLSGTSALDSMAAAIQCEPDVMAALNRAFEPARTPFDWLSRDPAEVDAYIADPFCGFVLTMESMISMLSQAERLADPQMLAQIPRRLAI